MTTREVPGSGIALQLVSCAWKIEVPENRVAGIAGVEKIELKRSTSGRSPEMKSFLQVTCRQWTATCEKKISRRRNDGSSPREMSWYRKGKSKAENFENKKMREGRNQSSPPGRSCGRNGKGKLSTLQDSKKQKKQKNKTDKENS